MSDAAWIILGYLGCAALCAMILSVPAKSPKQARLALVLSLFWPLLGLGVALACLFIICDALYDLVRRAVSAH
jgi:hypothetical protein